MLCCKEPFFITLNCSSFAGNPSICMDILAMIAVFNCSPVWVNIKCVLHSVCLHTFGFCGWACTLAGCVGTCKACIHTGRGRGKVGFRNCFLAILHSHKACILPLQSISEAFIFLFCQGGEGNFYCNHVQRSHMFLSSVPCFPTKCPTSPVVIPGCGLHTISSLLCVDVLAAAVSCGSTALGFCTLLLWQSSNTNVVSAATLLSNVNAIG